jgi:hypothetical protein
MSSLPNNNKDFVAISIMDSSTSYPPNPGYSVISVVAILYYWMQKRRNGFVTDIMLAISQTKETK